MRNYMKSISIVVLLIFVQGTMFSKPKLNDFNKIVYSQFGEDGIIEKIFEIIGVESRVCVEFGAADGFNCSNTANLFVNKGWKAVMIEADPLLASSLKMNVAPYDCIPIERKVGTGDNDNIAVILAEHGISQSIDLI